MAGGLSPVSACAAEAAQPQRVADDGDRAGGHRYCGEHGRQDSGRGERYEQQVVPEGPAEVLADDPAGGAGEHDRVGDGTDAAVDQGDVGGGHRRAGAAGDRDADVGRSERGCVVDVAGERLGITPDEIDGGHTPALGRLHELADRLEAYATEQGLLGGY